MIDYSIENIALRQSVGTLRLTRTNKPFSRGRGVWGEGADDKLNVLTQKRTAIKPMIATPDSTFHLSSIDLEISFAALYEDVVIDI